MSDVSSQPTFASFYDFYDGAFPGRENQLEMYRSLASEADGPVLELACGTGIITIHLAKAGLKVTGLDVNPEMLDVAREKISREDADVRSRIRLVEADMKDFSLDRKFSAIFIPNNSLCYLATMEDHRSCLRAIHDHLERQGRLVIEERNYTPDWLMTEFQNRGAARTWKASVNSLTGKYTMFRSIIFHIDFATQTIYGRAFIDEIQEDGTLKRYVTGAERFHRRHYFNRFELQLLIEEAGFTVKHLWGGHRRGPLGPRSYNMIFVADKA